MAPDEVTIELFAVDHRLSTAQDILLDRAKLPCGFRGMDIEIGQADHVACVCPTAIGRDGFVLNDKSDSPQT